MSRIGKKPIFIPKGVTVNCQDACLIVKGPKGTLQLDIHNEASLEITPDSIIVKKVGQSKKAPAIWGMTRALINSMVKGVTEGYQKKLELSGVGFRMAIQSKNINLALGFSHPVVIKIPEGIEAKVEENNILVISGIDKQQVGQFSANIRQLKKAEPYKGKGFRYVGEHIIRKAGKKAVTGK
jgi:large subunit ribosomal protein L6